MLVEKDIGLVLLQNCIPVLPREDKDLQLQRKKIINKNTVNSVYEHEFRLNSVFGHLGEV